MSEIQWLELSPSLFLFVSVILSLAGRRGVALWGSLLLSLGSALVAEVITPLGLLFLVLSPLALFVWVNHHFADALRRVAFLGFVVLGSLLVGRWLPGINNLKIFDQLVFQGDSAPFDMYLGFDKVYFAVMVFNILPPLQRQQKFSATLLTLAKYLVACLVLLLPLALMTGYVRFSPNSNPFLLVWAINNLFFVAFSEEVIFRRFLQHQLVEYFRFTQYGDVLAIALAAGLFGLAHLAAGLTFVGLASLAGFLYGLCFYQTNNIRSAMVLHFLVNLIHALFFTYPFAV